MPLIPEHILDEVQSRTDIAELIGRYVPLKRAGRHFKALCPFHKERTPSFHINTDKQIFHCFGCGVGGNIFSFLMHQERLTFPEAVRQVAESVGVPIPTQDASARNGHTEQQLALLEKACRYYERVLAHPQQGRGAREYLRKRGVTDRGRETFRLGCAPRGWDGLIQAAKKSQIPLGQLEAAGLLVQGPRGPVDRFRQRLIFPIQDVRGRVVGFGGRSLANQEPKYLNSPETPVYSKGRQLFGLVHAKGAIAKANTALLVEGYFDCLLLWQCGVEAVVSPLGTALTPEQARLLLRYTEHVTLAFDADAAGETATLRGIDVLIEAGFAVQVAQLPSGVDPDECIRAYGAEAFQGLVAKAAGVMEFLLTCAAKRYNLREAEARVRAAQFVLPMVAKVSNAMLRAEDVRLLAERRRLDEDAVLEELRKAKPRNVPQTAAPVAKRQGSGRGVEALLTALVLDRPARLDAIRGEPLVEQLSDRRLWRIVATIAELREAGQREPAPAQVISRLSGVPAGAGQAGLAEEELGPLVSELVQLAQAQPDSDAVFEGCVRRLRADGRKRQLEQLRGQMQIAQQLGREQDVTRLLTAYQQLVKEGAKG